MGSQAVQAFTLQLVQHPLVQLLDHANTICSLLKNLESLPGLFGEPRAAGPMRPGVAVSNGLSETSISTLLTLTSKLLSVSGACESWPLLPTRLTGGLLADPLLMTLIR